MTNAIEAEFDGDKAKLEWLVSTVAAVCQSCQSTVPHLTCSSGRRFARFSLWGKVWGLHSCALTSSNIHAQPFQNLTLLFSCTGFERKDFRKGARLPWAAQRLVLIIPFPARISIVSKKPGNLLLVQS